MIWTEVSPFLVAQKDDISYSCLTISIDHVTRGNPLPQAGSSFPYDIRNQWELVGKSLCFALRWVCFILF